MYTTFTPSSEEQFLLDGVFVRDPALIEDKILFIEDISNTQDTIQKLYQDGIRFIISFEDKPGFSKLRFADWLEEITYKIGIPYSLSVFHINPSFRKNPEELEDITSEGLAKGADVSWFRGFLKRYSGSTGWRMAWWREVLQNSVDTCLEAYQTHHRRGEITCKIFNYEVLPKASWASVLERWPSDWQQSKLVLVEVSDNGMGMTQSTLKKAFLTPGGSGKREVVAGKAPTGGLGKAKEMLFHAWPWWSVHTQKEGSPGIYVEAESAPYVAGHLLLSPKGYEIRERSEPGTTIQVLMKKDECVREEDLIKFIDFSEFNIRVLYQEFSVAPSGEPQKVKEQVLRADNKITVAETQEYVPSESARKRSSVRVLTRPDGSPWAHVYYMPHAKGHRDIIVRSNGLYLFSCSIESEVSGKIIIELEYVPKGMRWDKTNNQWVPMNPEEAVKQTIDDYGPLELLTEARDQLINEYPKRYQHQLNNYLTDVLKKPEVALKPTKPKLRNRVVNKSKNKQKDFQDLLEKINPLEVVDDPVKALKEYREIQQAKEKEVLLKDIALKIIKGELSLSDSGLLKKLMGMYTPQQMLQIKNLNIEDLKNQVEKFSREQPAQSSGDRCISFVAPNLCSDCAAKPKTRRFNPDSEGQVYTCQVCGVSGTVVHKHTTPTQVDYQELKEAIEEFKPSAVDTSVSTNLYQLYKDEILVSIIKEKQADGKGRKFGETLLQILNWEPDFIDSDETTEPTPRAPSNFNSEFFGPAERQIAKFWVEALRLTMILMEVYVPDLEVGFLFENPGSDNYLGEFVVEEDPKIGSFKAAFIAPGVVETSKSGRREWDHRYKLREPKAVARIIELACHELTHAILNLNPETRGASHNAVFASVFGKAMIHAILYKPDFYKLAKFSADEHPQRGARAADDKIVIEAGRGFYRVKCDKIRGAGKELATWKEVKHYLDAAIPTGNACEVELYYWPSGVKKEDRHQYIGRVTIGTSAYSKTESPSDQSFRIRQNQRSLDLLEQKLKDAIRRDWDNSAETRYPDRLPKDEIWRRNPPKLRKIKRYHSY